MSDETVHELIVEPGDAGKRLDAWLHERFPEHSRSRLSRLVQEGRVRVGGQLAKPSSPVRRGASVEVCIPAPPPPLPVPEDIPLTIVHEDEHLLVLVKPAGLVVHPAPGTAEGGTLVNALLGHTDRLSEEAGHYRPGIVHRLDRETSGLIAVARSDEVHRALSDQFRARTVHKEYLALAHGIPRAPEGEVDAPIARSLHHRKRMAIRHDEAGKAARTRWRVEGTIRGFAWFRCFPETGRTHQIRVHLKSIGHPIACDALYGREKSLRRSELLGERPQAGEPPILERHALHAHRLAFRHPASGDELHFEAPLPADLAAIWELAER